jgi:hypothetical protein
MSKRFTIVQGHPHSAMEHFGNALAAAYRACGCLPRWRRRCRTRWPALFYRWYFHAHSLKSLKRNILEFSGIGPIKVTLVGGLGAGAIAGQDLERFKRDFPILVGAGTRQRWLEKLRSLGRKGF